MAFNNLLTSTPHMIWGWTFCFAPFKHLLLGTGKKKFLFLLLSLFKSIDENASKEQQNDNKQ